MGQSLHDAAQAVFPNVKVYVLMLKWKDEDPKLPVTYDISNLLDVFENAYGFEMSFGTYLIMNVTWK
jgi:hypothetical protein